MIGDASKVWCYKEQYFIGIWIVRSTNQDSVQSLSRVWIFVTPWTAAHQTSLSITNSPSMLKLMSIESVMSSNHLVLCCPLLFLPSIFLSIRVFSNELLFAACSQSIRASASASFLSRNIQCWFPLGWTDWISLQSKGLKSLLQHHSSKASILRHSAFFMVQLSHPYMTTGKTIALTIQTFAGKVMSLLFNMLSRFVIAFLLRSKCLLVSWVQSPSNVTLEPKKIKSCHCFHCYILYLPEVMGLDAMILDNWMLSFKPAFSLSSFTFIKRLCFLPLGWWHLHIWLLVFLPAILIPACPSSNLAFRMTHSAYKLNKQGDNLQPWWIPFLICNQSVVPCPVLTVASWPAYRFLDLHTDFLSYRYNKKKKGKKCSPCDGSS